MISSRASPLLVPPLPDPGQVLGAPLRVGDAVTCTVDYAYRARVAPNHTMTHVLNHDQAGDGHPPHSDPHSSLYDAFGSWLTPQVTGGGCPAGGSLLHPHHPHPPPAAALRDVLCGSVEAWEKMGGLCDQKGSLVDDQKLRFDFSWNGPLTPAQALATEIGWLPSPPPRLPERFQV